MRKEISDRDIYIIALQTNLMSSREEIEGLKRRNDNLLVKNDELQKMVKEMNESYHLKKCESLRLSERIERQGNEIKKAEQTMRKYRECQFHNMRLREEKEHVQEELDELTKWTEALKTRYDIVEYEKKKTLSDHTVIMADFGSLQEELMKYREEMNEVQLVAADLREHVRHLEHDRQTYKRQRDGAFAARREAVLDRDKAFIERDQAVKKYKELKAENHTTIEDKILQVKSYDEVVARCDVMEEEVKQAKIKLRKTERELEELKVKCGIEDGMQSEDGEEKQDGEANAPGIKIVDSDGDISEKISEESISRSPPSSNTIVESIKRRVAPPSPSFRGTNLPTFAGPHNHPFLNSESIFEPFSLTRAFPKESAPKEGGLDRKGVSRMPIKLRQNDSKEDLLPQSHETQNEGTVSSEGEKVATVTSQSRDGEEHTQQAGENVEQEVAERQNSDRSGSSKVILYL
ncbi:Hypothetical predicted protein [Paramuricea clavata]|nr:Hypothetical predicted protein [Paramuricea clavata]